MIGLSEEHLALVDNQRNHDMLAEQLKALGHDEVQFRFVDDPPPEDSVPEPVLEPIGDLPEAIVPPEIAAEEQAQPKVKRHPSRSRSTRKNLKTIRSFKRRSNCSRAGS